MLPGGAFMSWQRQHAIQIAAQLPDNPEDARKVLYYARVLVDRFLDGGDDDLGGGEKAPRRPLEGPTIAPEN